MSEMEENLKRLSGKNLYVNFESFGIKFHVFTTIGYLGEDWWGDSGCKFHQDSIKEIKNISLRPEIFLKGIGG